MDSFDKPFRTFDELALLLRDHHGLVVEDPSEVSRVLQFIPYYDLANGYKGILMEGERFRYPFNITDLLLFHAFDRNFQNTLMAFSITIEDFFKNILAHEIARSFSVDAEEYLKEAHYVRRRQASPGRNITRAFILDRLGHIAETSPDNPTLYYREHHNHIPPWILLKNVSFSLSTNLFVLLRNPQKSMVVNSMLPGSTSWDQRFPVLLYSLTMIRKCRNIIAHNLKFSAFDSSRYMNRLSYQAMRDMISPLLLTDTELRSGGYLSGVYGYIVLSLSLMPPNLMKAALINRLISTLNMDGLGNVKDMHEVAEGIKRIYLNGLHIPINLDKRLLEYLKGMFQPSKSL